jgi:hypothetical protein
MTLRTRRRQVAKAHRSVENGKCIDEVDESGTQILRAMQHFAAEQPLAMSVVAFVHRNSAGRGPQAGRRSTGREQQHRKPQPRISGRHALTLLFAPARRC